MMAPRPTLPSGQATPELLTINGKLVPVAVENVNPRSGFVPQSAPATLIAAALAKRTLLTTASTSTNRTRRMWMAPTACQQDARLCRDRVIRRKSDFEKNPEGEVSCERDKWRRVMRLGRS